MIQIGAVYCSTMALAAVVALFASAKRVMVPQRQAPPRALRRVRVKRSRRAAMNAAITPAARTPLAPAMAKPDQGTSFIKIPPMLHKSEHSSSSRIALFFVIGYHNVKSGGVYRYTPLKPEQAAAIRQRRLFFKMIFSPPMGGENMDPGASGL